MIPRTTGSLPTQTPLPTKQSPTILCFKQGRERRGGGEVDESLNRPEEGHTGAMAIPKTTYLLFHNDSACQNKCQDTQPARNWLTPALSNQRACCCRRLCLSPPWRGLTKRLKFHKHTLSLNALYLKQLQFKQSQNIVNALHFFHLDMFKSLLQIVENRFKAMCAN